MGQGVSSAVCAPLGGSSPLGPGWLLHPGWAISRKEAADVSVRHRKSGANMGPPPSSVQRDGIPHSHAGREAKERPGRPLGSVRTASPN